MSVCGTDDDTHALESFSGQHYRTNLLRMEHLIPVHNTLLNGYNHEPALTTLPRTPNNVSPVREY